MGKRGDAAIQPRGITGVYGIDAEPRFRFALKVLFVEKGDEFVAEALGGVTVKTAKSLLNQNIAISIPRAKLIAQAHGVTPEIIGSGKWAEDRQSANVEAARKRVA